MKNCEYVLRLYGFENTETISTKNTISIVPWWVVVIVVGEVDVGIGPISRLHKLLSHVHSSTAMSEPWYLCSVHPIELPSFGPQSRLHRIVSVSFDSVPRTNDDRKYFDPNVCSDLYHPNLCIIIYLFINIYILFFALHMNPYFSEQRTSSHLPPLYLAMPQYWELSCESGSPSSQ